VTGKPAKTNFGDQFKSSMLLLARQVMGERLDTADEIVGVELNVLGFQVRILG